MSFYNNLLNVCEKYNISPSQLAKKIGLSNSAATYWKRGSLPKLETVMKICEYLGVELEDLIGEEATLPSSRIRQVVDIGLVKMRSGKTNQELADIMGVPLSTINNWENGCEVQFMDTLKKLAEIAKCDNVSSILVTPGQPDTITKMLIDKVTSKLFEVPYDNLISIRDETESFVKKDEISTVLVEEIRAILKELPPVYILSLNDYVDGILESGNSHPDDGQSK